MKKYLTSTMKSRALFLMTLFFVTSLQNAMSQRMYGTLAGNTQGKAGMIYSIDLEGEQRPEPFIQFDPSAKFGQNPNVSLTYYKGNFWGVTLNGGGDDSRRGVMFRFDPDNEEEVSKIIIDYFSTENGCFRPVSALTHHNGFLYGLAGGDDIAGNFTSPCIYRIDPESPERIEQMASFSQFEVIPFSDNNGARLISYNGALYGILSNARMFFRYDDKNGITSLFQFNAGAVPKNIALKDNVITINATSALAGNSVLLYNLETNEFSNAQPIQAEVVETNVSGFTKFRNEYVAPTAPNNQNPDDIVLASFQDNLLEPLSEPEKGFGDPRSLLNIVNGRFFVGTTSGELGGAIYAASEGSQFEFVSTFEELDHGSPQYAAPEIDLPFTVFSNGKWSNGKPNESTIAYIEDSLYLSEGLTCHDLYVEVGAEIVLVAGQFSVLRDVHNFGKIEILNCGQGNLSELTTVGSIYGNPIFTESPKFTPSANATVKGYLGQSFELQLQATLLTEPNWTANATSGIPDGLKLNEGATGLISGTPEKEGRSQVSIQVRDEVSGCDLNQTFSIDIVHQTTWNGEEWSNGEPKASSEAVINSKYSTSDNGGFDCETLVVNSSGILNMDDANNLITALFVVNNGEINQSCVINFQPESYTPQTNAINIIEPRLSPISKKISLKVGDEFSIAFRVFNMNADWIWSSDMPFDNNFQIEEEAGTSRFIFTGTPTEADITTEPEDLHISASSNATQANCRVEETYKIDILDGISPNLRTQDVRATFGDKGTKATATTDNDEVPYFFSMEENVCADINPTTGKINIICASVSEIEFYVTQAGDDNFKSGIDTATLYINKATPILTASSSAFVLQNENDSIPYFTDSDTIPTFQQFNNGGTDVATVSIDGKVELYTVGSFTVFITIPETDNYNTKTIKKTFTVVNEAVPPIGSPDTLIVVVGANDTINILENDIGGTGTIQPELTDIDLENVGVQSKFFSPSMGTFTIDAEGNLMYNAFDGFIGSGKIYYTIRDEYNTKSEPIYIYIEVVIPSDAPELVATELITPNDDDLNDAFVIGNVNLDKSNYLKVFDRYGNEVYYVKDYQNDWEGELENGDILDDGTYFFIFKEDDRSALRGTFQIKRQK